MQNHVGASEFLGLASPIGLWLPKIVGYWAAPPAILRIEGPLRCRVSGVFFVAFIASAGCSQRDSVRKTPSSEEAAGILDPCRSQRSL